MSQDPSPPPRHRGRLLAFGLMTVGIELAVSIGIGFGFGYWLDGKLGTQPWLLIGFGLIGVAAGFRSLIRTARRSMDEGR